MVQLYKMLVSPYLEIYDQSWSPCYGEDVIKLERMQKKDLPGLGSLSYWERLDRLGRFFTPGA